MNNVPRPSGLTIAGLRNMAAGFPPDIPLLVPRANGEGYEPLVIASAFISGRPDGGHARRIGRPDSLEREREKRAAANPPPDKATPVVLCSNDHLGDRAGYPRFSHNYRVCHEPPRLPPCCGNA